MGTALMAAEAAHEEASRVTQVVQGLLDAALNGQQLGAADMARVCTDMRFLAYAVARTYHAVQRQCGERRDLPLVRAKEVSHG